VHNYLLEAMAKQTEKALEDLKTFTVELNRERKNMQVSGCLVPCDSVNSDPDTTGESNQWTGDTLDGVDFECTSN
jgi:hypothetical protein